ncbi:MAG: glycosyl hydrolase family 18 protein, partial [Firmicutes bacterium]|nr:glycosyl hydrolase family 18 protein [Bacillota bacterium]
MGVKGIVNRLLKYTGVLVLILALTAQPTAYANVNAQSSKKYEEKFNMSYIYFGQSDLYNSQVAKTKNSLNEISPNYFNISKDGDMELTPAVDAEFIDEMHSEGIKVVPFLSNHWDSEAGRNALENGTSLAEELADAVKEYNLDGINVDIEGLNENDRDSYTEFVKILRSKLPEGISLSVAVAANPRDFTIGWQGSYDYESLAKYADYLMIMAYDEHYGGAKPGPVASSSFVEDSIKYALERVPKEKIVLGIPFYGRYW